MVGAVAELDCEDLVHLSSFDSIGLESIADFQARGRYFI